MIGLFKQKNPAIIFVLLIFGVLIKLPVFLHPHLPVIRPEDGFFFKMIVKLLATTGKTTPIIYPVIAFSLLFLQALLLTIFINARKMMSHSNFFPGMAYLLITSFLPEWNYFSAPLIVNTILLLVFTGVFKIYNQQNAKAAIYNSGLALGICSFLFFSSIAFLPWLFLALAVMRSFRISEWIVCLAGILTPFYFYAAYLFISDQWSWQNLLPYFSVKLPLIKLSAWQAGSFLLLIVPLFTGGYFVQHNLRRMRIQIRKGWILLFFYSVVSLFVPFINNNNTFENWIMVAIPFAAFHACVYLYSAHRIIPLLFFWLSIAFILSYQYAGPGWQR